MDVIPLVSKPTGMPDLTPEQLKAPLERLRKRAPLTEYLQQMDREALSKYDDMSVGEAMAPRLHRQATWSTTGATNST